MAIEFSCEHCGRRSLVEDEMAGMKLRCAGCGQVVDVPRPEPASAGVQIVEAAPGEPAQRCPVCREPIQPRARKCRHCHEFLDRELAIAKAREEEERIKRRIALEEQESRLAKVSLICAVVGLTCPLVFAGSIVAILMSIAAQRQIKENPRLKGLGMARTGLIIGIIGILMWPAIIFFAVAQQAAQP